MTEADLQRALEDWLSQSYAPAAKGDHPLEMIRQFHLEDAPTVRGHTGRETARGTQTRAAGHSRPPGPAQWFGDAGRVDRVMSVLRSVDAVAWRVVMLRTMGASRRDIANLLGRISVPAVDQRYRAGMTSLLCMMEC